MILLEIKQFFKTRSQASLLEVAQHFKLQVSAAQGMVDYLVKRGVLQACTSPCSNKGSGCNGCVMASPVYQLTEY